MFITLLVTDVRTFVDYVSQIKTPLIIIMNMCIIYMIIFIIQMVMNTSLQVNA